MIQGPCADILKMKMLQIAAFLEENNLKSQMVLCVHDELQFRVPEGEDWIVPHIQRIMQDTPDVLVPIVAEVEFTETIWSDKQKILNVEALDTRERMEQCV